MAADSRDLETELEAFRKQWLAEARQQPQASISRNESGSSSSYPGKAATIREDATATATVAKQEKPETHRSHLSTSFEGDGNRLDSGQLKALTAIELYADAVSAEIEGKLNDAVLAYRKAFKLDAHVDKAWHQQQRLRSETALQQEEDNADPLSFSFAKTLQLGPDYKTQETDDDTHPSSTKKYARSLVDSFEKHPYVPPSERIEGESTVSNNEPVQFIPDSTLRPCHVLKLPDELWSNVLRHLIRPANTGWYPRANLVEQFALVSRKARLLTLQDASIWKTACQSVLVPPHQLAPLPSEGDQDDTLDDQKRESYREVELLCKRFHGNDWRRAFIEQPKSKSAPLTAMLRIQSERTAALFQSYPTSGEGKVKMPGFRLRTLSSIIALSVLYSRLTKLTWQLRFYSDGTVISLVTTVSPSEIARSIDTSLRMKGLQVGQWRLRGDQVTCWSLEDRTLDEPKYTIEMSYRLKSTARGKMNKLVLNHLWTANRRTAEIVEVPLQHNKSFYFSRVLSYEGL